MRGREGKRDGNREREFQVGFTLRVESDLMNLS